MKRPEISKTLRRIPFLFGGSLPPNVLSKKGSFARFSFRSFSIGVTGRGGVSKGLGVGSGAFGFTGGVTTGGM